LRRRAERQLEERTAGSAAGSDVDVRRLVHELEVHQIELEMQNDELRASRLQAEQAAARYTEIHDFAPVGYAALTPGGAVRSVNFTLANLLGVERSRLLGKRFDAFVFRGDRAAFEAYLQRTLAREGEAVQECELALEPEGKERADVRLKATALGAEAPEILLAVEDVTERRKRQEELEEALRLLNASQRSARLGTFAIDLARQTWSSSHALDEILGIGPRFDRSVAGFLRLAHPEDRAGLAEYLRAQASRGARLDLEYRVVLPSSQEVRWAWARGDVEYDAMEPIRVVGTLQDITERKRMQLERAELLRAAEASRAEAEQANRSKDAFIATLSHELRNPLTPISNSLFILERSEAGSEQAQRAAAVIHRQIRHLARLVDDLLDATRIEHGKVELHRQRLDLNELARSAIEDHRSLFELNGISLELAEAPAAVFVDGDWHRLAQIIGNLLQNAAKFCHRGGAAHLAVSRDEARKHALLRVADDGVGMAPEMLARLFKPFMQADTSLVRSKGGLGLGLSLSRRLVEIHGGVIEASSPGPGKGSVFVVRLPLASEQATAAPGSGRARSTPAARRVLIIEDNVDSANSLREVLELHRHDVAIASSGPEGIAKARELHPEIVLCDIGLPGMDGYEVARAIRSDRSLDGTYLIALSGYASAEDVRRASQNGFDRHIAKPPSLEDLERILAEAPPAASASRLPSAR
jgi:two-component system CheB/CheR fusion protein